jgi:tetratricopeptide (TPR) repeat protein
LRCWASVFLVFSSLLAFGQFEDSETALRRADTALGQGRFDVALQIYDRVLRENPNITVGPERCRNIADANIRATHPNLKAGVDWLQRAADQLPGDDSTRQRLADVLLRNGDNARAANQYRLLVNKSPANQQYVLGLAIAQRNLGLYDEATSLLSSTLKDHPEYNLLHIEYGRNLSYQHQFQAATEQYQEVLKSDNDNLAARLGMAKTLSWQGNQEEALVAYDKVLQRDPGNYDALVGEAFSLIWTGRQNDAIPLLERANSRHPEDTEVRDALKRLGGVNVFTGETRAGETPLPILPPAGHRPTNKVTTTPTETKAARLLPEKTPPQPEAAEQPVPASSTSTTGERRTIWWVVGMGAMMMVAVFAVAGFLLFVLPSMREKREAQNQVISNPIAEHKAVEPWVRLEEFSRGPREEPTKEPPPPPKPVVPEPEPIPIVTPAETLKAALARGNGTEPSAEPSNGDERTARSPRRRRGAPPERPWWRELPTTDQVSSLSPDNSAASAEPAPPSFLTAPIQPAPAPSLIDPYDSDTIVLPTGAANPLTPASERPHAVVEEPPTSRPFTLVLSRALERAGDGQVEEVPSDDSTPTKSSTDEEFKEEATEYQAVRPAAVPEREVSPIDDVTLKALQGSTAVLVGCGVMVSHYRSLLRAAGIDVRMFTFWDLAMTSMRKRRADILIIDGDALDGFTAKQMYTSAHVERYMFKVVLVGVASDEDRTSVPEEVVLPHSLSDDDIRARLVDSLRAS